MRTLVILTAVAVTVSAQNPLAGEEIVFTDNAPPAVWRYNPTTGAASTITNLSTLMAPAGCAVTRQGDVVFVDTTARAVYRVNVGGSLTTLASNLPCQPIRVAMDHNGDAIVTGLAWMSNPSQVMRITPGGTVTNIFTGLLRPFGVCVEPSGDYLVTSDFGSQLIRISRDGTTTSSLVFGVGFSQGVALFPNGDYAVMSTNPDIIYRVPPAGGSFQVFIQSQPLGNPGSIIADGQGGFLLAESGFPNGARLVSVDATGSLSVILSGSPLGGPVCASAMPRLTGPETPGTGPGAVHTLTLSFPQDANATYLAALSQSLFPGISFPGGDPRSTPLNPDSLFVQSFGVGFPGITSGWAGMLSASGGGAVTIDLTSIPAGLFAGSRVYFQVAVTGATSPTGITRLSEVLTLLFT